MGISYIVSIEELSVLANLADAESFEGLPALPDVDDKRRQELLCGMDDSGLVKIDRKIGAVSVDMAIDFILSAMAKPELVIRVSRSAVGYCTKNLGVVVSPDRRTEHKYRITPFPDAESMVEKVMEHHDGDKEELAERIDSVYNGHCSL